MITRSHQWLHIPVAPGRRWCLVMMVVLLHLVILHSILPGDVFHKYPEEEHGTQFLRLQKLEILWKDHCRIRYVTPYSPRG